MRGSAGALLLAALCAAPAGAAVPEEPLPPREVRARRRARSEFFPYRALALPAELLELPWIPLRRFLDFSERVDLFARAAGLFYFDEAHTRGWFPNFASGESAGGAGLSLFHHGLSGGRRKADAAFSYASGTEFSGRAAYTADAAPESPRFFKAEAGVARDPDVEIYAAPDALGNPVFGPGAAEGERRSYSLRRAYARADLGRRVAEGMSLSLRAELERAEARSGEPGFPPLPARLRGLGETLDLAGAQARFVWDFRNDPARPTYGCVIQLRGGAVLDPGSAASGERFGYSEYAAIFEHYVPVIHAGRALVFRHSLHRTDPLGGRAVPFYRLPRLDENHLLRSFKRNRFRDRGAASFNVEYRYPVWTLWDAFFFFDGGQTFERYGDIRGPDLRFSEGLGLRFLSKDKLLFAAQYARGREGGRFQLTLGQVF